MGSASILPFAVLVAACSPDLKDKGDRVIIPSDPVYTTIGDLVWMTRNLEVANYRNGDPVPQVRDQKEWVNLKTGAWCWYNNDSATYGIYGRLYNWYAVDDARGLAPEGWHVLTDTDWEAMETSLGEDSVGYRMRTARSGYWPGVATAADNRSGFEGLPSGKRSEHGTFSQVGHSAVYWTSTEGSVSEAWCGRLIHYADLHGVPAMVTGVGYMNKSDGYAVRCVKDR